MTAEIRHERIDGCELRYRRVGRGTPVVLLHPLRMQLEYFAPLIDQLDTTRFDVIAVDLPGHGESAAPAVNYTASYVARTVSALLEHLGLREPVLVGESIGATVALAQAATSTANSARVAALNPYDYRRWGGIRRSSPLTNIVFTSTLWPIVGPLVPYAATKQMLRLVIAGGLHDRHNLPAEFVDDVHRCGLLPGHPRACRSLSKQSPTWISAREAHPSIKLPVTLVYGEVDWSRPGARRERQRDPSATDSDSQERPALLVPGETSRNRRSDQRRCMTSSRGCSRSSTLPRGRSPGQPARHDRRVASPRHTS
jgi:pimeloyl-ACP methyl ester carboxylesterase